VTHKKPRRSEGNFDPRIPGPRNSSWKRIKMDRDVQGNPKIVRKRLVYGTCENNCAFCLQGKLLTRVKRGGRRSRLFHGSPSIGATFLRTCPQRGIPVKRRIFKLLGEKGLFGPVTHDERSAGDRDHALRSGTVLYPRERGWKVNCDRILRICLRRRRTSFPCCPYRYRAFR